MRMTGHQLPCVVSSLFKKALNHGGLAHKMYMRKNAVSGRKNTTKSMLRIAIDSKIRADILINSSHILGSAQIAMVKPNPDKPESIKLTIVYFQLHEPIFF